VDDEKPARDELAYLLKGFPEINVIGQGKNGVEAVALIKETLAGPGISGCADAGTRWIWRFEKTRRAQNESATRGFCGRAFDHYAVQAFDVNAVDYV